MTVSAARRPVNVFFSYAHQDAALRDELGRHLVSLARRGVITTWHDREILPGDEWRTDIDRHLRSARVILLLISDHFLSSGYCMNIEMREALERHAAATATVIPVYLRPCRWRGQPFAALNGLPSPGRPVTRWAQRDKAFATIATGIARAVAALPARRGRRIARSSARARLFYARGIAKLGPLVARGAMTGDVTPRTAAAADAAVADFDRALSLDPDGAWATWEYYHRGVAHHCKQALNDAIADYSHAIDLNRANAFALRQRANAYAQLNEDRRALADYARAIRAAPDVAKTYYNRGLLYLTRQPQKAIADFRNAVAIGGDPRVEQDARERLAELEAQ